MSGRTQAGIRRHFSDRAGWRSWLADHHDSCSKIWLVFYKKHTGRRSIDYGAAVEEALCFGWIDSLIKRLDDDRFARRFTPRTDPRKWSAANLERVQKMVDAGLMTEAGLAVIPTDITPLPPVSARTLEPPALVTAALAANPRAQACFDKLPPSARRDYLHWIMSAKREATRRRRLDEALALLAAGKKPGMK